MGMFQKLVAYKEQHKNTMVPCRYDKNPKLGRWVAAQRRIYKKDELDLNRVDLLNSIDFNWDGISETKGKVNGNYVATTTDKSVYEAVFNIFTLGS